MRFNPRKVANKKNMNKNDPELASKICWLTVTLSLSTSKVDLS